MFNIGDFARHGRVSVRMLRHYDALGLLRPARVDAATGYRYYQAAQLSRLNRVIALKDLGFTLQQVQSILDEEVDVPQLQGMLRLRRAELAAGLAADQARLASVEARLSIIENEGSMSEREVRVKTIPAVRVAELSAVAAGYEPQDITPVIRPLYARLCDGLDSVGVNPIGPAVAYYETVPDGVRVHACLPVSNVVHSGEEFEVVVLPEIEAATTMHHGPMAESDAVVQELAAWIEQHGYSSVGYAREVNLECPPDENQWVTEFQEPVHTTD